MYIFFIYFNTDSRESNTKYLFHPHKSIKYDILKAARIKPMKKNILIQFLTVVLILSTSGCGHSPAVSKDCTDGSSEAAAADHTGSLSFSDFRRLRFTFTSGAGAWATTFTINEDGSFSADMDKVLAEGSYVSEISTADIAIAEWSGITGLTEDVPLFESRILSRISELSAVPSAYSVLRTTFTVTYNDASENGDYAGKTDTISSVVLFRNINMLPVFSYKTADLQASNASYSAFADYLAGENIYSQSDVDGTVTDSNAAASSLVLTR